MSSQSSTSSVRTKVHYDLNKSNSVRVKSLKLDHSIPNIQYEEDRPVSPTQTDMDTSLTFKGQLNVIISKFKLNKEVLQNEFMSKDKEPSSKIILKKSENNSRKSISKLLKYSENIYLISLNGSVKRKILIIFVQSKRKHTWKIVQRGEIKADYPLMENVESKSFYNEIVIAKPFQLIKESDEHKAPTNKRDKEYSSSEQLFYQNTPLNRSME